MVQIRIQASTAVKQAQQGLNDAKLAAMEARADKEHCVEAKQTLEANVSKLQEKLAQADAEAKQSKSQLLKVTEALEAANAKQKEIKILAKAEANTHAADVVAYKVIAQDD